MSERIRKAVRTGVALAAAGLIAACATRENRIIDDKNVGFIESASCSRSRNNPVAMPVEDAVRYAALLPGRTVEVSGKPKLAEKYIREDDSGVPTPSGVTVIKGHALRRVYDLGDQSPFYVVVDKIAKAKADLEAELSAPEKELGYTAFRGCAATDSEGKVYLRAQT